MPRSSLATKLHYDMVFSTFDAMETRKARTETNDPPTLENENELPTNLRLENEETSLAGDADMNIVTSFNETALARNQRVPRRKRFNPTREQSRILETDFDQYSGKVPEEISRQCALEFGVHKSQVTRYGTKFSKQGPHVSENNN